MLQTIANKVTTFAFYRPSFRNQASLQVDWLKRFYLAFSVLRSSWLALKFSFVLTVVFGFFTLKKLSSEENITSPFFGQHICKMLVINAILDRRSLSDVSKI